MSRERLKEVTFSRIETRPSAMPFAAVDRPLQKLLGALPGHQEDSNRDQRISGSTNDAVEAELFGAFSNFCAQGMLGDNQCMDSKTFSKVCRDCSILDDVVTPTMVEIIFQQILKPGMTQIAFSEFCLAMRTISERKGLETMSLFNQIIDANEAVSLGVTKKMPSWWDSETLKSTQKKVLEALALEAEEEGEDEADASAHSSYEDLQEFSMDSVRKTYFAYCIAGMSMNAATAMTELMQRGDVRFCGGVMMEMRGNGLMDSKSFEKLCAENQLLGRGAPPGHASALFCQVKDDKTDKNICFPQFQDALHIIAKRRGVPAEDLLHVVARSKGPVQETIVDTMMRDYVPGQGGGGPSFAQPLQRKQQTPLQGRRRTMDSSAPPPPRPFLAASRNMTPSTNSRAAAPPLLPPPRRSPKVPLDGLQSSFPPSQMPAKNYQQPLRPVKKPMRHSMDGGAGPRVLPPRPPTKQVTPQPQQQQEEEQQAEDEEEPKNRGPASVKGTFLAYCAKPAERQQQQQMSGAEFAKLCRDCSLVDSGFTAGMADNVFCKVKKQGQRKIRYKQFMAALHILAEERGFETPNDILKAVAEQREPTRAGTKAEAVRFYDKPSGAGLQRAKDKLSRPQTGEEDQMNPAVKAELKTAFEAFSVEEAREDPRGGISRVRCIDSYAFSNLCKVSGIAEAVGGPTTVDLMFARVKNPGSRRINFLQFVDSLRLMATRAEEDETTANDLAALVIAAPCSSPTDGRRQQQQQQLLPELQAPPSGLGNRRSTYS